MMGFRGLGFRRSISLSCAAALLGGVALSHDASAQEKEEEKDETEEAAPSVQFFADDQIPVGSAAVRVKRGHLVHSGSVYPARSMDEVGHDFASALDELPKYMATSRFDGELRTTMVKLHVCIAPELSAGAMAKIAAVVDKRWPDGDAPAITVVGSSGGDTVVVDAVWQVEPEEKLGATEGWVRAFDDRFPPSTGVISPKRDIIHVSGRAASGDLSEATTGTMVQLFEVLEGLGAGRTDVVQVKAFIKPVEAMDRVEQSIADSFESEDLPPIVFVEWSSTSRATEIEVIAVAPDHEDVGDSMSYYTPPTDKPSPVFSRVGRIHGDEVIFIGGLAGTRGDTGEGEVLTLYEGLKRISAASGTDLRHFAKATYYVSGNEASTALNALRPHFYDPQRPPAASKVTVRGVGMDGRSLLIDMIAAPLLPKKPAAAGAEQ